MGFDLETTGLFPWMGAQIELIALRNQSKGSYVLEAVKYSKDELKTLFLKLKEATSIGHNIKFDTNFVLYHFDVLLDNVFCTQVASQIIDNGRQMQLDFDLISVITRYLGHAYSIGRADKKKLQKSFIQPEYREYIDLLPALRQKQIAYAAEDVEHLIDLYHVLVDNINSNNLYAILRLEMKTLPILSKMEVRGVQIDKHGWQELVSFWEDDLTKAKKDLDTEALRLLNGKKSRFTFTTSNRGATAIHTDLFGYTSTIKLESESAVNYGSSDQLIELWKEFGETPPKDKDGVYSVGEDAIETYVTERRNTKLTYFIELLLEFRGLQKLVSTYGNAFLEQLDVSNCIHTSYTQTRTETGRLSSKEPNLQNIPRKKNPRYDVRRFFIARNGYKLITCDMKSAEIVIAADYSKEPVLMDSIQNGTDMHSKLASASFSLIFGRPIIVANTPEEIEIDGIKYTLEDLRDDHKRVTFSKFYKAGPPRVYTILAKYINKHHAPNKRMEIASAVSEAFDAEVPILSAYLSNLITEAKTAGFLISDKLGRRRFFKPNVYGEAANYPIQGTNANALKIALIRLNKHFIENNIDATIIMNIHDEVVVEVREDLAEEVALIVQEIMAASLSYLLTTLKGGASVSISNHWKK